MIETICRRAAAIATWAFIVFLMALTGLGGSRPGHAQAALPEWQEYRSVAGGFRIEFPGKPVVTAYNRGGMAVSQADLVLGTQDFMASSAESGNIAGRPVDNLLSSIRARVAREGRVRGEERRDTAGFPSMRLIVDRDQQTMVALWILKQNRWITVTASGPSGFDADPTLRRYFDSFQLNAD
ncbi:hypothetical protein [Phreatobacter stygius]|uniref:DUF1795 domain-containing protein n=1 Tax=Phreatobacter stygius TaxID=1940610 RepID=A0A4D7B9E8_9HYPH|nr:hypothetical protein [Phreatobacter stygius]QCI67150.1 hypothetical protein E8M01_24675 [Phreatobacter stygius]